MTITERPTEIGLYRDPSNGDLWELNPHGWRWVNGNSWRFIPQGLVRVGDAFGQKSDTPELSNPPVDKTPQRPA